MLLGKSSLLAANIVAKKIVFLVLLLLLLLVLIYYLIKYTSSTRTLFYSCLTLLVLLYCFSFLYCTNMQTAIEVHCEYTWRQRVSKVFLVNGARYKKQVAVPANASLEEKDFDLDFVVEKFGKSGNRVLYKYNPAVTYDISPRRAVSTQAILRRHEIIYALNRDYFFQLKHRFWKQIKSEIV